MSNSLRLTVLHTSMKRLNQTESPVFVILCVFCFQRQSFFTFIPLAISFCHTLKTDAQPTNIYKIKKDKRKVQGVPQSQTAALPRPQEEEETDKSKQAQTKQTYEKHQD